MTIWVTLAECAAGFAGLALGSERARRRLGLALPHWRGVSFRIAGLALLMLAALQAMADRGVGPGLVSWCGQLSLGAGMIYLGLIAGEKARERTLARRRPARPSRSRRCAN